MTDLELKNEKIEENNQHLNSIKSKTSSILSEKKKIFGQGKKNSLQIEKVVTEPIQPLKNEKVFTIPENSQKKVLKANNINLSNQFGNL